MALLSRWRLARRLGGPPRVLASRAVLVAGLALIEVLGRGSAGDPGDLLALVALAALALLWLAGDRPARRKLGRIPRKLQERFVAALPTIGVDLRGEPVIPRGEPLVLHRFLLGCAFLTALECGWIFLVDVPFRAALGTVCYVALLLSTAALWSALLFAVALSVGLVFILLSDTLRLRDGDRRRARLRGACMAAYAAVAVGGMLFVPDFVALLVLAASVVLYSVAEAVSPLPRLSILWRDRSGRVGAFELHQWIAAQSLLFVWPVGILVVAALGGEAVGRAPDSATPITGAIGSAAAWSSGPSMLVLSVIVLYRLRLLLRSDPATRCATSVHLAEDEPLPSEEARRARERLEARGWTVRRPPDAPDRLDVRLRLVASMPKPEGWPLAVSAAGLASPELLDLIARRDVVQRRRVLMRGLERMLKRARRRRYAAGTGFWIAPHHWFVAGLTRDEDENEIVEDATIADAMIGEPYHVALPLAARRHAHEVFSGLEVDLMFVEDGVTWKDLRRVLRRAFDHFDGKKGRVDELAFRGIPRIRVILHKFEIGGQLGRARYPEPDYEDLGRARVLHVFKDRGGDEELDPAPSVDEGRPLSVG